MKNNKEWYQYTQINKNNIHNYYTLSNESKNLFELTCIGCAMLAHLNYQNEDDFRKIENQFYEHDCNHLDYHHFLYALVKCEILTDSYIASECIPIIKMYRDIFDKIEGENYEKNK